MANQTTTDPAPEPVKTAEELRAEFTAELNRYTEAFGSENGTKWFQDGLDFSAAQANHIEALKTERDALADRVEQLEKDLQDVQLGEVDPVDLAPSDGSAKSMEDFCGVPNQAPSAN